MEATDVDNYVRISTHTLTWSVTMSALTQIDKSLNFNSHAHVERDALPLLALPQFLHFNSHAHVERDDGVAMFNSDTDISTHTLTWSVTQILSYSFSGR